MAKRMAVRLVQIACIGTTGDPTAAAALETARRQRNNRIQPLAEAPRRIVNCLDEDHPSGRR
jgi:hypothetical protein